MPSASLYSPLQHRRDIRLLRIKPKRSKKGIEVTFSTFRIDSDVQFTALSYVWGCPTQPSWIICNGRDVPITHNLWSVLSQLQDQGYEGLLWADAICINQQDNEEKSIQVGMMRDIYKRAANVIFWLGEQESDDEDAVHLMNAFYKNHQEPSDLERLRAKTLKELGLSIHCRGWVGWASLLFRPWFGRVWIVQEYLNATRSVFMSRGLEIPTKLLIHCAHATGVCAAIGAVVTRFSGDVRATRGLMMRPMGIGIDQFSREIAGDEDVRIFDLWTRSQLLEATDPRDRVFALLSTQTAVGMDLIDYNKDEETVYTDIARVALTLKVPATEWHRTSSCTLRPNPWGNGPQRVSRFLACTARTTHSSGLPSWVPDWRPTGLSFVPLTRYYPGSAYFTHQYEHAIIENKTLYISGIIVDGPHIVIDSTPYMEADRPYFLSKDLESTGKSTSWVRKMLNWQAMCYLGAISVSPRSTKHESLRIFCRAMAFGALPDRSVAPDADYIAGFQALHNKFASGTWEADNYSLAFPNCDKSSDRGVIYESVFYQLSAGRKFCITNKGSLAWVPRDTKLSDRICFLAGCAVPFVTRPVGKSFELLGDCYLHSMMCDESITFDSKPRLLQFR